MNAVMLSADERIADIQTAQLALAAAIEREITRSALELGQAMNQEARMEAWVRLQWLHTQRSPITVKQIEIKKGLA